MELNEKLNEEMKRRFEDLEGLDTGSEEQGRATDNLVKLCNVKIALEDKAASRKADEEKQKLEEQKHKLESRKAAADVALRIGVIAASGIGALFAFGSNKTFLESMIKFEETGTFCSFSAKEVARNALSGLRTFRK